MRSVQQGVLVGLIVLLLAGWGRPQLPLRLVPATPRTLDVPILLYHRIALKAVGLPGLTVPPAEFAAEMRWLHGAGFHAITQLQLYDALERGARLPPRPFMVTFDDGYRDVLWNAAPLLHRLRMPATEYVITSRVDDGDPSFLSWPELRRLRALGFDIGSHTVHHVDLTALPVGDAYTELLESRLALERHLHTAVPWFAYPFGRADAQVARLAARAGYLLAVTEQPGETQSVPLQLERERVLPTTGLAGLRALVESG